MSRWFLGFSYDIPSVNHTRQPSENGKTNVDEEISAASALQENGDGREEDCEEVEEDIAR